MALFVFEELSFAPGKAVNAGLRLESVKVDSFGGGTKGTSGFAAGYEHDGWVAGLVCAFPAETVAVFKISKSG